MRRKDLIAVLGSKYNCLLCVNFDYDMRKGQYKNSCKYKHDIYAVGSRVSGNGYHSNHDHLTRRASDTDITIFPCMEYEARDE